MKFRIDFLSLASEDVEQAYDWYEQQIVVIAVHHNRRSEKKWKRRTRQ